MSRATRAGGSAKQARDRRSQAVLPLRGKILNVASAGKDKLAQNAQLADLIQALGCGTGAHYHEKDLRYEKVIIMTDADVDGAHIASLLITFFYRQMPKMIEGGKLYLAVPPLFRLSARRQDRLCARRQAQGRTAQEGISRQRQSGNQPLQRPRRDDGGAAERNNHGPGKRTLLRVVLADKDMKPTAKAVERLMGNKAEARFEFIQENAEFASEELLDV